MKPLYMWAGGKNKMIPKYLETPGIPYSGYDTYVEPFFGGGAMMIHIAENNPTVKRFVLNDINKEIVGLYTAIKTDPINFMIRMDYLESQYLPLAHTDRKKYYYSLRKEYTTMWSQWNTTDESATLYFLMKTAFNGIWQTNQTSNGRFATPCGLLTHTTKVYDKENITEWHTFLQKVDIYSGDWKECIKEVDEPAFFFFDPPYRDSFTQYDQVFTDEQHLELIEFCKNADDAGNLVMYCNRDTKDDFYTKSQGQLEINYYGIKYTVGRRATNADGSRSAKDAIEILLSSPRITPAKDIQFDMLFSKG